MLPLASMLITVTRARFSHLLVTEAHKEALGSSALRRRATTVFRQVFRQAFGNLALRSLAAVRYQDCEIGLPMTERQFRFRQERGAVGLQLKNLLRSGSL